MFHAVGVTPEAPTLEVATGGAELARSESIATADLRAARDELSTVGRRTPIGAVSVGTPHLSLDGLDTARGPRGGLACRRPVLREHRPRRTRASADEQAATDELERVGVTLVTDTCTYITPVIQRRDAPIMTDSAKWAWYAPGNLGFDIAFGSMEECVRMRPRPGDSCATRSSGVTTDRTAGSSCPGPRRASVDRSRRAAQLLGRARSR